MIQRSRWTRTASRLTPLGLVAVLGCNQADADEGPLLQTAPVEVRDLQITAEATGEVEPIRKVEVKSKASGEILRLHVDTGDPVEPGSLLADIDPRDVRNAFEQAEADLEVAQARLEIARAQFDRTEELLESEVITRQEWESGRLELANAQAALVKAETNRELAELRLSDVTIRAPMSGTILEKNVEEGQVIQSASGNVSGGTTLFIMASLDEMRVRTLVDETDVGQLRAGLSATVSVEAFPDRTFQGEIEKIEPQAVVEQNVTMFPVIVLLDNRAGLLKPGMNAEVEVLVNRRDGAVTVPNNAVVTPQEMAPAAEVLGLDPEVVSVDREAFGALMAEARAAMGLPGGGGPAAAGGGSGPMADIRARVESGEITQDSARALFRAMREQGGGAGEQGMRPGGNRQGGQGFARGGGRGGAGFGGARGGASGDAAFRPGVAFVVNELGNITAKPVVLGLNDWDYAEVLAGLEAGEEVALIGAAQLQARQQERLNQIRGRMGGRPF